MVACILFYLKIWVLAGADFWLSVVETISVQSVDLCRSFIIYSEILGYSHSLRCSVLIQEDWKLSQRIRGVKPCGMFSKKLMEADLPSQGQFWDEIW